MASGHTNMKRKGNRQLYIKDMEEEILKAAKTAESKGMDMLKVRVSALADKMDCNTSALRRNGYPHHFANNFESIIYREYHPLVVNVQDYIEELEGMREKRKEEEKEKELEEIEQSTVSLEVLD